VQPWRRHKIKVIFPPGAARRGGSVPGGHNTKKTPSFEEVRGALTQPTKPETSKSPGAVGLTAC